MAIYMKREFYTIFGVLVFTFLACKKESSHRKDCDEYAIKKIETQGFEQVKGNLPENYSDLMKGEFNEDVVYFMNTVCITCNTMPVKTGFNCDGSNVEFGQVSKLTNVKKVGSFFLAVIYD